MHLRGKTLAADEVSVLIKPFLADELLEALRPESASDHIEHLND